MSLAKAGATDLQAVQRHTVRTLMASQAIGAIGMSIGFAAAALLAAEVSGSEAQAGLVQTVQVTGAAFSAYLLARLMARRGRRFGLGLGFLLGGVGALLCVAGGALSSMPVLLVGALCLGATTAANNASRYAATDLAEPGHRARALSLVVWATTLGAVLGPNLTGLSGRVAEVLGIPELTGPFAVGSVAMLLASLMIFLFLRPDPLLLAREGIEPPSGTSWGRVGAVIAHRPVVAAAMVGLAGAHAAMVSVMVMTPIHMHHGHAELDVIGFVLSIHVLGMFAFSPVVGWLTDRFGRPAVLALGGLVQLVAVLLCGLSPVGTSWEIFTGLFLLGLGWSCATVSSSTLLSEHTPIDARTDVQGAADLGMGLTAAAAGGLAGLIVARLGYDWLNGFAAGLACLVLAAAVYAARAHVGEPEPVVVPPLEPGPEDATRLPG